MDPSKYMIIVKGEDKTNNIESCELNMLTNKYDITYFHNKGKCYSYNLENVFFMSNPIELTPDDYIVIKPPGKFLSDIKCIYQFDNNDDKYWYIVTKEDIGYSCKKNDLQISKNCLSDKISANTFDYLKDISQLSEIKNDNGEHILQKYYKKISSVSENVVLSLYLDGGKTPVRYNADNIIFPFGCNQSQYKAVKNALKHQISVIHEPPGTGKTQTILNIIANLIINGKSVIVVSNNNAATENVLEKLAKDKYGMSFMVATLGSLGNKEKFIKEQRQYYPDLSSWETKENPDALLNEINELAGKLQYVYQLQEQIARLKEEYYGIELEYKHFKEYVHATAVNFKEIKLRRRLPSEKIMCLWQEIQAMVDADKDLSLWVKLKCFLLYGIGNWNFYKQSVEKIITVFQVWFYERSLEEISVKLKRAEMLLESNKGDYDSRLEMKSLEYLKSIIAQKYDWKKPRQRFLSCEALNNCSREVLKEYPIVLSTTFSSRTSLNTEYDYVIMDEASQVDVATGALALSCAKNAVIVGDLKQLPNVIASSVRKKAEYIKTKYSISDAYDFVTNSFLQSIVSVMPNVPSTLLKEHYRCHPRIISFCNQKFYNGKLVIMTKDDNLGKALKTVKTVAGNHARGNYNQREIDVIKNEILPTLDVSYDEIGIITPYNDQVKKLSEQIPGIEAATVHKFQGREKDIIILSTVDNKIKEFTDNPYLLNVAVSRAKKRLIVVTSGNEQSRNGNIMDLISYIEYNGMEVVNSRIYSVFDYLYSQYREQRWKWLKKQKKTSEFESEYASEKFIYVMLTDILKDYTEYGIQCFQPLAMIIRNSNLLSEAEKRYVRNPATHVDFLIFNKLSKEPILVIEVDGYKYHAPGTIQYERDLMKNKILREAGINILRLKTNESGEKERVLRELGCN